MTSRLRGIDLAIPGQQIGSLDLVDTARDFSRIPVPIAVIGRGEGPTALLVAGTHGDEYEGQIVLHRLVRELDPDRVVGRLVVLPALNLPAVLSASRTSPIDAQNLNRVYPGAQRGTPTMQLAAAVIQELLPLADIVLDLHSGGTSAHYLPSAFVYAGPDRAAMARKQQLAEHLGLPWSMLAPEAFEPGSLSAAADRSSIPMIATETCGGGEVNVAYLQEALTGVERLLMRTGILDGEAPDPARTAWLRLDPDGTIIAPVGGIFEPLAQLGDEVRAGDSVARIHPVRDLTSSSSLIQAERDGVIAIARRPPLVVPGDHLFELATPISSPSTAAPLRKVSP